MEENWMSENLPESIQNKLLAQTKAAEINITGNEHTFVSHADTIENNFTVMLNDPKSRRGENSTRIVFNTDFYHLFVISGEKFDDSYFLVPKDRALTESTSDDLKRRYASLTPEAVDSLKCYPAIFADENHSYGKTDEAQDAYFGFVKDIKIQDNGIKIYYTIITAIPQQRLNEQSFEFGISGAKSFNELNRTHWALKNINVIEALQKAGVRII
jgi:hypothetical protein